MALHLRERERSAFIADGDLTFWYLKFILHILITSCTDFTLAIMVPSATYSLIFTYSLFFYFQKILYSYQNLICIHVGTTLDAKA